MDVPSTWFTIILPAAVFGGAVVGWGIFHPRSRIMGPLIHRGWPSDHEGDGGDDELFRGEFRGRVALTFDDGPTPDSTPAVLDALKEVNALATFFVVGRNVERHPDLLRRMHDEGHLIANHTYDHDRQGLWGLNAFWRRQIDRADDAVLDIIGRRPAMFRPPMGLKHWHLMQEARYGGHAVVTWSRKARDGGAKPPKKTKLIKRLAKARDGDILLLHDGHEPDRPASRRITAEAVVPLVNQLRDRGLQIVRLDELLDLPGYQERTGETDHGSQAYF
ncbi:MAG: polysaccharide deacetylase family protein [Planctomycetota bacterium]